VGGRRLVLHLRVRRFRCGTPACPRRTFAEQVPTLVARYARRSLPLQAAWQVLGLALGGRPGARVSQCLAMPTSRMTLLRLVRAVPEPEIHSPRVLGVDEFAIRRGRVYGTLLIDAEKHRPVDLLEDPSADAFATWLARHPGAEVICRDRAGTYAEGAGRGAPQAIQVADRWHLLANLGAALERLAARHARCWRKDPLVVPPAVDPVLDATAVPGEGRRAARHRERYAHIQALRARGMSLSAIGATLGLSRKTVRKFAHAASAAAVATPGRAPTSPVLVPFLTYLDQRWREGCEDGSILLPELQAQGYRGSGRTLRRYLTARRRGAPPRTRSTPISARRVVGLILRRPETLDARESRLLEQLCQHCPDLAAACQLARSFAEMLRQRHGGEAFEAWATAAESSTISEIRGSLPVCAATPQRSWLD
jgi:transposase